jgi:hypothetical protein
MVRVSIVINHRLARRIQLLDAIAEVQERLVSLV